LRTFFDEIEVGETVAVLRTIFLVIRIIWDVSEIEVDENDFFRSSAILLSHCLL
jgi:hypothetical protein